MATTNWMSSGEMVALGWTLLHFCWQGTALAMVYGVVSRVTTGASRNVRYAIGMATVALMPLAALVTFVEQERLLLRIPRDGHEVMASQLGSLHSTLVAAVPLTAPTVERTEIWIAWNADRLLPWVVSIWLAGVLVLAVRAVGGWWKLEQIRGAANKRIPVEVMASFRRTAMRLHVGGRVILRLSDEVISPMAMGIWKTAIILPVSAVMQLTPMQLEAVLAHEIAHVRRWDYLGNLFQTAVECLLFFHPAVWWVSRHTRDLRELCCDEVAVKSCEDPTVYVEALLRMEEQRTMRLQLAMALRGRDGSLLKRVKQVLGEEMTMERETMCGVRIGVFGAVVLALILGPTVAKGLGSVHSGVHLTTGQSAAAVEHVTPSITVTSLPQAAPVVQPAVSAPEVAAVATPAPVPMPTPRPVAQAEPAEGAGQDEVKSHGGLDYLTKMRDAGYPLDLNKDLDTLISLRSVGVTPEFAKGMAQAGLGTPSLHDLIALKSVGVTPEYVSGLKASGLAPDNFHEVIADKSVGVTPEYAKQIASIGLGNPTAHDLVALKAQGVTPEYVAEMKASGIAVKDLHELTSMKAVGVTPEYAKGMATSGFAGLSAHELVSLRAQDVTPEYIHWLKQAFPNVDLHGVRQAAVFHVDAAFVAKAKAHGFNEANLDKLVKLKMTGLLD